MIDKILDILFEWIDKGGLERKKRVAFWLVVTYTFLVALFGYYTGDVVWGR